MTRQPLVDGRVAHPHAYRARRFWNWFPLGVAYALLYMGRYNLNVAQGALGGLMTKGAFGDIFFVGALVYGVAFVLNGPLTDRIGGRAAMLIAVLGAAAANAAMGFYLRATILGGAATAASVKTVLSVLYALNMYFQSFGAVAIVKVNSAWFHVRERGGFSGIFGVMISAGIFFAYDGNQRLLDAVQPAQGSGQPMPSWVVFFAPAIALAVIALVEVPLLRDAPSETGHDDIDTGALVHDGEHAFTTWDVLKRVLTHPVILTVAFIELCTGALRQGVMQWMPIYAREQAKLADASPGWTYLKDNWGLILFVAGVIGGNVAGFVSDAVFGSRRAPAALLLYALMAACMFALAFALGNAWEMCVLTFLSSLAVIGVHGLLSGTATMDFGG
ncbi:MAG TPA: MFS transporter, partial [Planctomycetota bacterium]|nr:MFS transporter [Planctomycetota bacterium]